MSLFGVVIGLFLSEVVVRSEGVRTNDESVEPRVCRQRDPNGGRLAAICARFVEQLANCAEVRCFLSQRSRDGGVEFGRREALEDLVESAGVIADISATLGDYLQQFLAVRSDVVKPVEGAVLATSAFDNLELTNVLGERVSPQQVQANSRI